jgi:DNA-directed RNA polymerase specialized sigma24 family protein
VTVTAHRVAPSPESAYSSDMSVTTRKQARRAPESPEVLWHVVNGGVGPGEREEILRRLPNLLRSVRDFPVKTIHVEVDYNPRKGGYGVSVSLPLPAKTLHAAEWAREPGAAGRRALGKVAAQVATYRSLLRRFERRSHRGEGTPAEAAEAAPRTPAPDRGVLERFRERAARHVRHEIVHDPAFAGVAKEAVSVPDVVDEAMVWTLEHLAERPPVLTPEQFLWRRLLHQLDLAKRSVLRSGAAAEEEAASAARHVEPEAELDMEWQDAEDLIFGGGEPLPLDLDEAPADGSEPSAILDREAAQRAVAEALRELPEGQRRAILLHDLEGYDPAEIALVLFAGEDRVRRDLEDARRTLRRRLREYA